MRCGPRGHHGFQYPLFPASYLLITTSSRHFPSSDNLGLSTPSSFRYAGVVRSARKILLFKRLESRPVAVGNYRTYSEEPPIANGYRKSIIVQLGPHRSLILETCLKIWKFSLQREAIIEPDAMADDLAGEVMVLVAFGVSGWRHVSCLF
jgi:hypothetical protein